MRDHRHRSLLGLLALALGCASGPGSSQLDDAAASDGGEVPPFFFDAGRRDAEVDASDGGDAQVEADAGDPVDPSFDAEAWEGSVIYMVMTDRFADGAPAEAGDDPCTDADDPSAFHGGDFAGLSAHLDYLEDLGVDTIWITPVPAQVGCGYHGYWADLDDPDDHAIEPRLGGAEGLTRLIDDVHARDMRLMVDHVVNHPGRRARITETHPDWFHPGPPACEALGDPRITCSLAGLPDFAHERVDVADYLRAWTLDFMERFTFDAMRLDTVKHVPVAYFRDDWVPAVLAARPGTYLLGEIFDEDYGLYDDYLATGIHGMFDFPLRRALIDAFAHGGSVDPVARRVRDAVERFGPARARLRSTMLDNHDVPRFLTEMHDYPVAERRDRFQLALAVLFTTPGIPQLYYGTELGMMGGHPENRRDMPAWAWDASSRTGSPAGYLPEPGETHAFVRRLAALRREVPALAHGDYLELWRPGGSGVELWAFLRSDGAERAIVTFNAGATPLSGRAMRLRGNPNIDAGDAAAYPDGVTIVDRFGSGASARVDDGDLIVDLPARSVSVWTLAD